MAGRIKGMKYKSIKYPYPLTSLKKKNLGRRWKVRARFNDSGYWVLYLHLQQYIHGKIKSTYKSPPFAAVILGRTDSKHRDKYVLERILEWRDKIELQYMDRSLGLDPSKDANRILFIDYYDKIIKSKELEIKSGTINVFNNMKIHWQNFIENNDYLLGEITTTVVKEFKDYLLKNVYVNTAGLYLSKFKYILKMAMDEDILDRNPANNVKIKTVKKIKRFLTAEELILLEKGFDKKNRVMAAFLFSVYTGARISDIRKVKFDEIRPVINSDDSVSDVWDYQISKTGTSQRIYLPNEALDIIELMRENSTNDIIFELPTLSTVQNHLRRWAKNEGVKDFTFHVARHTWASLNASVNDILYLKEGLGHSNITTTQIYSHLQPGQKLENVKRYSEYLKQVRKVYNERRKK